VSQMSAPRLVKLNAERSLDVKGRLKACPEGTRRDWSDSGNP